jgi:alpha-L-fucosidase
MDRRDFCRIIASAAVATVVQASGQTSDVSELPHGFDMLTEDYAQFCATPAQERVFFVPQNGQVVRTNLDEKAWEPTRGVGPDTVAIPGGSWNGVPLKPPIAGLEGEGPYKPEWDSLLQYEAPEWYRDAKFGIWAHWSPQCVPEDGDWYARRMYNEGSKQNEFHREHYGPPSRFGYKDLCPQWTLLNWDPDELIQRYKTAGARIFFALANHHDSFDTWNSKHQPWNAMNIGPHRDVIGTWAAAARKQGLRFGVTVHQARNWWWFQTSHGADRKGPLAGVPFDGALTADEGKGQWWQGLDPQRLYGPKHPVNALPDISYVKNFYDRTRDLIDQYDPDLLYFDDSLFPLGWAGMNIGSYFYNHNLQTRSGKMEGVINVKHVPDQLAKAVVADYERALTGQIMPHAWQSETCIGQWHYNRKLYEMQGEFGGYLDPRDIIHWLIDTVSKNGTFILNIPGRPDGTIDAKEAAILDRITAWMRVNGEAIYATRPWKVFGEGPDTVKAAPFKGTGVSKLGVRDIRFTRNKSNTVVYAIVLGWPTEEFAVQSLGTANSIRPGTVEHVELLGTDEKLKWVQTPGELRVKLPKHYRPETDIAAAFKVSIA